MQRINAVVFYEPQPSLSRHTTEEALAANERRFNGNNQKKITACGRQAGETVKGTMQEMARRSMQNEKVGRWGGKNVVGVTGVTSAGGYGWANTRQAVGRRRYRHRMYIHAAAGRCRQRMRRAGVGTRRTQATATAGRHRERRGVVGRHNGVTRGRW